MKKDLNDKIVIITGASSGIGLETALEFAKKGAKMALAARRADKLEEVAERIRSLGSEALVVPTDVSKKPQVDAMVKAAVEKYGRVDILVNNAGFGQFATIEETTSTEMKDILNVNYMGTFNGAKAVLPHMRRQGSGHIINISSIAGHRGLPLMGAYCVTKVAQKALTETLRIELADTGIDVSLVCPVVVKTGFFHVMNNKSEWDMDAPGFFTQSVDKVAKAIVKCAENPKPEVLPLPFVRILIALNGISPGLVDFLIRKYFKSFVKSREDQSGDS